MHFHDYRAQAEQPIQLLEAFYRILYVPMRDAYMGASPG
jgi:hypothetical protein